MADTFVPFQSVEMPRSAVAEFAPPLRGPGEIKVVVHPGLKSWATFLRSLRDCIVASRSDIAEHRVVLVVLGRGKNARGDEVRTAPPGLRRNYGGRIPRTGVLG